MREVTCETCGGAGSVIRYTPRELRRMREAWGLSYSDVAAAGGFEAVGHLCDMEKLRRPATQKQIRAYLLAIEKAQAASNIHAKEAE